MEKDNNISKRVKTLKYIRKELRVDLTLFTSLALIVASGIGVLAGGFISQYISERHLHYAAAIGFIGIGIWTFIKA